jgi:succinylglutamate desuccinylase
MTENTFIWLFLAFITFIVLSNSQTKPSKKAGWLYAHEMNGLLKIGKASHWKNQGQVEDFNSLQKRLSDYINPSERPGQESVKVIYYHFFEDVSTSEDALIDYLRNCTFSYKTYDGQENTKNLFNLQIGSKEWFHVNNFENFGGFSKATEAIIYWFNQKSSKQLHVKEIINRTQQNLEKNGRVFISNTPSTLS